MKIGDIIIIDKDIFLEKLKNFNVHNKHELVIKIKSINDNSKFRIISIRNIDNRCIFTLDREFVNGHINIAEIFVKKITEIRKEKLKQINKA